jgi:L-aminopeptidase/D-esterase-like protein
MGHDGLARTINPAHTPWDGDTLFAMSTGETRSTIDVGRAGTLAAEIVSQAILRGAKNAASFPDYPDYPSWQDTKNQER